MAVVAEKNCSQIRKKGYSSWLGDQPQRWTCKKCGSKFSFKDETCPSCKADVYSCKDEAADYRRS
jgi:rubrerythrin